MEVDYDSVSTVIPSRCGPQTVRPSPVNSLNGPLAMEVSIATPVRAVFWRGGRDADQHQDDAGREPCVFDAQSGGAIGIIL